MGETTLNTALKNGHDWSAVGGHLPSFTLDTRRRDSTHVGSHDPLTLALLFVHVLVVLRAQCQRSRPPLDPNLSSVV